VGDRTGNERFEMIDADDEGSPACVLREALPMAEDHFEAGNTVLRGGFEEFGDDCVALIRRGVWDCGIEDQLGGLGAERSDAIQSSVERCHAPELRSENG